MNYLLSSHVYMQMLKNLLNIIFNFGSSIKQNQGIFNVFNDFIEIIIL